MGKRFLPGLAAAAFLVSCGKKESSPPPTPVEASKSVEDVLNPRQDKPAPPTAAAPPITAPTDEITGIPGRKGEPVNPKDVKAAIDRFFDTQGRFPNNWQDLIRVKFITGVPLGKNGQPLEFTDCVQWIYSSGR